MGLDTSTLFYRILSGNAELEKLTDGRIYSIAIPMPEENINESLVPWIIILFDGLNNDDATKDDPFESRTDTVQISIEIAAQTPDDLMDLAQLVRDTIHDEMVNGHTFDSIYDYKFSAAAMQYDDLTPCFYTRLSYSCSVSNVKPSES